MTGADLSPAAPEPPEDLAGEYVLGVLDAAAWREASLRLRTDDAFAAEVRRWEDRLAPLLLESRDAAPSRDLWPDIRRALPALQDWALPHPPNHRSNTADRPERIRPLSFDACR